jgi:hypothetical protein
MRVGTFALRKSLRGGVLLKTDEDGPALTGDDTASICAVCAGTVARVRRLYGTEGFEHALNPS